MVLDLRTEHQKKVEERAKRVCEVFQKVKNSKGSITSIWKYIAETVSEETGQTISPIGVRDILIRNKLYEPSK